MKLLTKIIFDPDNKTNKHKQQSKWKHTVVCVTKCDLVEYYSWFLFKRFNLKLNRPLRGTHITIINDKITNIELYNNAKKLLHNQELIFDYDPSIIRSNGKEWWIKIDSLDAENIRTVCGLSDKYYYPFHMTIGSANEKNIEHSQYILETIMKYNL